MCSRSTLTWSTTSLPSSQSWSRSQPSEATFWVSSGAVSSKANSTPGSPIAAPRTRNSVASSVLPDPAPPATSVVRPRGSPPDVIASRPSMPVGQCCSCFDSRPFDATGRSVSALGERLGRVGEGAGTVLAGELGGEGARPLGEGVVGEDAPDGAGDLRRLPDADADPEILDAATVPDLVEELRQHHDRHPGPQRRSQPAQ